MFSGGPSREGGGGDEEEKMETEEEVTPFFNPSPYLIFVIFCTRARFFKSKFYTQKRVNEDKSNFATK